MTGMSNGWTLGESSKLPPGTEMIEFAILEYTMADINCLAGDPALLHRRRPVLVLSSFLNLVSP
jgi:hypothetical protein